MRITLKRIKSGLLYVLIITLISGISHSTSAETAAKIDNPPLYLIYDVTYAGGRIAEVDFTESKPYSYKGQEVREIECRVESSGLFDLNGLYRSIVADDYSVVYFRSDEGTPGNKRIIEYHFDYQNRSAVVIDSRVSGSDTVSSASRYDNINKKYFDTVSMIFKIRQGVDTLNAPAFIPLFLEGRQDSILIDAVVDVQHIGSDGEAVDAFLIKAKLPRPPYPGFGDRIEIYISKDEKRIPLRGRIQMALGFLEITLRPQ
jgi:hypothetical protein